MSWIWWCYCLKNLPHTCCSISLGSKKRSQSTHTCAKPLIQSLKAGRLSQLSHGMTDHSLCRVPVWFRGCCTADDDSTQQALHELSPMPLCCCTHHWRLTNMAISFFFEWTNCGSERLSDFLRITQCISLSWVLQFEVWPQLSSKQWFQPCNLVATDGKGWGWKRLLVFFI